jgi:hypothetical protein
VSGSGDSVVEPQLVFGDQRDEVAAEITRGVPQDRRMQVGQAGEVAIQQRSRDACRLGDLGAPTCGP